MRSRAQRYALPFTCLLAFATRAQSLEIISFEPSARQSKDQLVSSWQDVSADKQDVIRSYLVVDLGLSSTGTVQLIGVYREDGSPLLHFQQLDLYGVRLVWSVLVDPTRMNARVIYHQNEALVSDEFAAITRSGAAE